MTKEFLIEGKYRRPGELKPEGIPLAEEICAFLNEYLSPSPYMAVQTSGSTSAPKTIHLSKEHMRNSARATLKFLEIEAGQKILLCISPGHIGGIMVLVRWLEGGLDLYTAELSAEPLHAGTPSLHLASLVPLQLYSSGIHLDKIEKIIIGGAPLSEEWQLKLRERRNEIYQSYGMTETISHVALRLLSGGGADEHYTALPGVSFSSDARGCLQITAPHLGVKALSTNDMVQLLNPQQFIWQGRWDNVINSGGIKLIPEEIEKKIGHLEFPFFLTGLPDERLGEKLTLVIESRKIHALNSFDAYFQYLGPYEKPRELICLPEFVRTETAKIARTKTMETYFNSLPKK